MRFEAGDQIVKTRGYHLERWQARHDKFDALGDVGLGNAVVFGNLAVGITDDFILYCPCEMPR